MNNKKGILLGLTEQKLTGIRQNNEVMLKQGQRGLPIKNYLGNGMCLTLIQISKGSYEGPMV